MNEDNLVQTTAELATAPSGHQNAEFEAKAKEFWALTRFMSDPSEIIARYAMDMAEADKAGYERCRRACSSLLAHWIA